VLLTVVDNEGDRDEAGKVTYTIRIRNQGPAPDQQIRISATLPEGREFVEGSGEAPERSHGHQYELKRVRANVGQIAGD
jgi:uncharacterized repeat protein (TIGR01451 family)